MRGTSRTVGALAVAIFLVTEGAADAQKIVTLKIVGAWAHGSSPTANDGKNFMRLPVQK
jgi:hypothetical protein